MITLDTIYRCIVPMDIAPSGDSIMVMCDKDIHHGCLLMYSYVASDGCRYSVYDKTSACVKEQVFEAVPGDYTCGGGFVVDDNTSCITFSANTALSKSTDLLISEVITGVDSVTALVERLDTYKVNEQDYQDIINLYLDAAGGSGGGGGGIVKLPDDLVYSGDEDPEAATAPVDADTLGGKTESQLHVAKAADADKLAGVDASQYMQKGDIGPTDSAVPKAGFIYPLATPEVPDGFLLCDGAAYNRADYPELFDAIGTYYGEGDGSTTFNVPNLQTRVPVGAGGDYTLGDVGGEATNTHKHWQTVGYDGQGLYSVTGMGSTDSQVYVIARGSIGLGDYMEANTRVDATFPETINNMQPYTVVNYIIATGKGSNVNVLDVITGAQAVPLEPEYGGTGVTSLAELMLMVYPVGSIYVSSNPTSPTELFGGIWEAITDVVIVGAGGKYDVNSTGGEETHTLTVDEMPSHAHIAANYASMVGWTGSSPSRSYLNNTNDGYVGSNNPTTKETGGGAAHNNMQPYIAKYIWERVG